MEQNEQNREPQESITERNKSLFRRMDDILSGELYLREAGERIRQVPDNAATEAFTEPMATGLARFLMRQGDDDQIALTRKSQRVDINIARDEEDKEERPFPEMPKGFSLPSISFEDSMIQEHEADQRLATPYGVLPLFVIGADRNLYMFENIYFFDEEGNAAKLERVALLNEGGKGLDHSLNVWELDKQEVQKVDFVPSEEDARFVPLEPEDYEKIEGILHQIESGEFKEI